MMSNSAVNSDQISVANSEFTTSAKTVHLKDIQALRKTLKHVENQATTFNRDLINSTFERPLDANSLKRVLSDLDSVAVRADRLVGQIKTSSYPHCASKMSNLEMIKSKIDTLKKNVSTNFDRSQKAMQESRREGENKVLERPGEESKSAR